MKRFYLIVLLGIVFSGCASKPKTHYTARLDSEKKIEQSKIIFLQIKKSNMMFIGNINTDDLVSKAQMGAYIAIDPISFMAQLAAHSAVIENDKNKLKIELQNKANKVLIPLQEGIDQVETESLKLLALNSLSRNYPEHDFVTIKEDADYLMVTEPIFVVVDDSSQIIVKNIISLYKLSEPKRALYQNMVEVMSKKVLTKDTVGHWQANDFEFFVNEVERIFQDSILLAARDIQNTLPESYEEKTMKFYEGTKPHYERVKVIENSCNSILYRNLRGWLKQAPIDSCNASDGSLLRNNF